MLRKTLLTTSAFVVASSMAFAHAHPTHRTLATLKTLHHDAMVKKGMIVSKQGIPLGVKSIAGKTNAVGKPAKFIPGGYSNFSKSKNALFISWFGWFAGKTSIQSGPYSGSFCISYSGSTCVNREVYRFSFSDAIQQSAAQPVGKPIKSASAIDVAAAQYSGTGGVKVNLYSNTSACGNVSTLSCPGAKVTGAGGTIASAPAFTGLCCSSLEAVTFSPVSLSKKAKYWVVLSHNGNSGRVAWEGQASDWTAYPNGEQYNANIHEVINSSFGTTRSGFHTTFHTSFNSNTGWIHTSSFTFEAQPGAFSVN